MRLLNKHHGATPTGAVYIGRGSPWGNPFVLGADGNRETVIRRYEVWIRAQPALLARLPEIAGRDLVCFCAPAACHGGVLIALCVEAGLYAAPTTPSEPRGQPCEPRGQPSLFDS